MGIERATEKLLKRYPNLSRILGWCSLASILLGYLASAVGNISELKRYLFEVVGPQNLLSIHFGMSFLVVSLFLVGYLALTFWLHRQYLSRFAQSRQRQYLGILVTCGVLLTAGSIYAALPPVPDVDKLLETESKSLERELLDLHVSGGGLRPSRFDQAAEPQVWTTAQILWAVLAGRSEPLSASDAERVKEHLHYIERVRLPDDEGWGYMQSIGWGVTEIAAWVVLANIASTQQDIVKNVWGNESETEFERIERYLALLKGRQIANGGWAPVKENDNEAFARTYSTVIALWAMIEARKHPLLGKRIGDSYDDAIRGGIKWLLTNYNEERKSWVPNPVRAMQTDAFPGLTAQVLYVLERAKPEFAPVLRGNSTYEKALQAFVESIEGESSQTTTALASRPAGTNERMHDSDSYLPRSNVVLEGSTYLWFPWTMALCSQILRSETVEGGERNYSSRGCSRLLGRVNDMINFAREDPFAYVMAESLFSLRLQLALSSKLQKE